MSTTGFGFEGGIGAVAILRAAHRRAIDGATKGGR
jgi:hypothetical protein